MLYLQTTDFHVSLTFPTMIFLSHFPSNFPALSFTQISWEFKFQLLFCIDLSAASRAHNFPSNFPTLSFSQLSWEFKFQLFFCIDFSAASRVHKPRVQTFQQHMALFMMKMKPTSIIVRFPILVISLFGILLLMKMKGASKLSRFSTTIGMFG